MAIVTSLIPLYVYNQINIHIQSVYSAIRKKLKPGCHYKFISPENMSVHSASSDYFLNFILEVAEQKMWNYSS